MNCQSTRLQYWDDTYLYISPASVLEAGEDEKGAYLILDSTIFHPQGGGQPGDRGVISSKNSQFQVDSVISRQGLVYHRGQFTTESQFTSGESVTLEINKKLRLLHARLHTAGELLRLVTLRLYPEWKHLKSCHFPNESSVDFLGLIEANHRIEAISCIEKKVNQLIDLNLCVETKFVEAPTFIEMKRDIPSELPSVAPLRVVIIDNEAILCGGTHVKRLSEIGLVNIRKIKAGKGTQTKISYAIS